MEEQMSPGRALDALVADKVMGWKPDPECPSSISMANLNDWHDSFLQRASLQAQWDSIPHYSTDIAAAWKVFLKTLKDHGCDIGFNWGRTNKWHVTNLSEDFRYGLELNREDRIESFNEGTIAVLGDTAPHAICLAALQTIGK